MSHLNSFFKLVDKKISKKTTSTEKEILHKGYIELFFSVESLELTDIREKECEWIENNIRIESFNNIFRIGLEDIGINQYLIDYENFSEKREKKDNEIIFKFYVDNNIQLKKEYLENVILKDNGNIEIKYKQVLKKDDDDVKAEKELFNQLLNTTKASENFNIFFDSSNILEKVVTANKSKIIIKFKFNPTILIKTEYQDFIKIKKEKVIFKKQSAIKNPFLENEKYFLIKLQDEASVNTFEKYKIFKDIYTYFKNSTATKDEKITYTPDDLAKLSSVLLYEILNKLNFFENEKIVFADYLCGSGNLAMSFIKTIEDNHNTDLIKYLYLNDINADTNIGNILNEYLKPLWNSVPSAPITNIEIDKINFPIFYEEGAGRGRTRKVLPNVIMSNPDFNSEVENLKNIFIEKSNNKATLLLFNGKVLEDVLNYTKIVIKLDSSELFLNTSSKVYLNIFIPNEMANDKIRNNFINIPDIEKYFLKISNNVWKDKKREIDSNLLNIIIELIFNDNIKNFNINSDDTYVMLKNEILLNDKSNDKSIHLSNNKIFLDSDEEVSFDINEFDSSLLDIIDEEKRIYYISNNENNFYNIPDFNGNINEIVTKKYEELKGLL